MSRCGCCGGEKIAMLAPNLSPMRMKLRPKTTERIATIIVCRDCDSVRLWPTAYRFKGAW